MKLRRVDWLVIAAAALVILIVALLPSPRDNNPPVPDTPEHRPVRSERDCVRCHAAGQSRPPPAKHPKRQDCFRCHRELPPPGTRVESH
jgi:predicted CXXCH cytochrome family protein